MRVGIEARLDYWIEEPAEVLLLIEAAALPDQQLHRQSLWVSSDVPLTAHRGTDGVGQRTWALGRGRFVADYHAEVEIVRSSPPAASLPATPLRDLPDEAVPYLLPSRYCEAAEFEGFVHDTFPGLEGGALATALAAWVRDNLRYRSNASSGTTTALDTFARRRGVCRDYAHLLVALARAGGIPARCVSAYAPGVDPPDFHAVAELWLAGGWRLFDATGMGDENSLVRVAVGRDATDIAFMTIFGEAQLLSQSVRVWEVGDGNAEGNISL
ncbi:transglutaminase-like domain-containing protein [Sphingomonas aracearum]|uniref:Transglutaminase family protein n=1 Tax=Sphingomonas aracearum TaxID=2283317 RepID=A0A369VXC5_9SPHN|nr:transglutaminase family protein [Sphingomonas aracearum]RDE06489.1 transglutaminase family protein [Sphingomonas aracearum]